MKLIQTIRYLVSGFVIMVVTVASPANSAQIQKTTLSSGSGKTDNGTTQIYLTVGQSFIGKSGADAGNANIHLGFWETLNQTYVVSVAEDDLPFVGNHFFKNFPNPFNPSTQISFNLDREVRVRIDLYDLKGRKVDTLLQEVKPPGAHAFTYQPKNLASGVYVMLMRAGSFRASQRIMLVK